MKFSKVVNTSSQHGQIQTVTGGSRRRFIKKIFLLMLPRFNNYSYLSSIKMYNLYLKKIDINLATANALFFTFYVLSIFR